MNKKFLAIFIFAVGILFANNALATNGACGPANGTNSCLAPTSYLCSAGTASAVSGNGSSWTWVCTGNNYGTNASCSANVVCPVNGTCSSPATHYTCAAGTSTSNAETSSSYTWSCQSSNGGTTVSCTESKPAVNGACGSANGQSFSSTPSSNLCSAGTATGVTSGTNWTWSCQGSNYGTNASCTAYKTTSAITSSITDAGAVSTISTKTVYTGNSGTSKSVVIPYINSNDTTHSRTFYLYNNSILLNQKTITASCSSTDYWDTVSKTCQPNTNNNGSCSATHYNCIKGTSANNIEGTDAYTWICEGGSGGTDAYCSENKTAPSGTLSVTSCTIPNNASTCSAKVSWTTANLISGAATAVTRDNPANTTVSSATSGTNVSNTVNYGTSNFYLYHNGTELAQATITANCVSGNWNNSSGKCVVASPLSPTAGILVSPSSIASGGSATVTWTSSNTNSCTGTGFDTGGATSGSVTVSPTATTTYSIVCDNGTVQASDQATITITGTGTGTKKPGYKEN